MKDRSAESQFRDSAQTIEKTRTQRSAKKKITGGQSLVKGAFILSSASIVSRFFGVFFRIPLTRIMGAEGNAYFYYAYQIFDTFTAIAIAGMPVALARMVAESVSKGYYKDVKKLKRLSVWIFTLVGVVCMCAVMIIAKPLSTSDFSSSEFNYLPLMFLAPSILFLYMMSSYRGYYEGLRNMKPTAISQVIEAVVKVLVGVSLSYFVLVSLQREYFTKGTVMGQSMFMGNPIDVKERAYSAIAPYAATAAILGVTISTLVGIIYLYFYNKIRGDGILEAQIRSAPRPTPTKALIKRLALFTVPICLGAMVGSLTSQIDTLTLQYQLGKVIQKAGPFMAEKYASLIEGLSAEDLPIKLYGVYTNTFPIFSIVPSLTHAFGLSALPSVTLAWTQRDKKKVRSNVETVLRMTSLIAIPAGFGLITMAGPVMVSLFNDTVETRLATPLLSLMGISVIFVSIAAPISSMLQAIGKPMLPVKFMFIGSIMKIICNNMLVSIPGVNINGATWGTLVCYVFIVAAGLSALLKETRITINFIKIFIKPLIGGVVCGVSAKLFYLAVLPYFGVRISTFAAIAVGALAYVLAMLLIRGITKNDVASLPGGEKILKRLEKRKRIV
ncbi:MAG: polysaccharide biosynthesis protein [Oscillospiraceae bacterium]|nr:polysaccharide biosynthesis protein [Oscillospiraceae bacterium]